MSDLREKRLQLTRRKSLPTTAKYGKENTIPKKRRDSLENSGKLKDVTECSFNSSNLSVSSLNGSLPQKIATTFSVPSFSIYKDEIDVNGSGRKQKDNIEKRVNDSQRNCKTVLIIKMRDSHNVEKKNEINTIGTFSKGTVSSIVATSFASNNVNVIDDKKNNTTNFVSEAFLFVSNQENSGKRENYLSEIDFKVDDSRINTVALENNNYVSTCTSYTKAKHVFIPPIAKDLVTTFYKNCTSDKKKKKVRFEAEETEYLDICSPEKIKKGQTFLATYDNLLKQEELFDADLKNKPQHLRLKALKAEHKGNDNKKTVTPTDGIPPVPKQIKLQHRIITNRGSEARQPLPHKIYLDLEFYLEYDYFIKLLKEDEDDMYFTAFGSHCNLGISSKQRTIIIEFLIKLNASRSYPSTITYQTVRLFDDVMRVKEVAIEHLQLTALAALWITLKKDYTIAHLPTASKIISFAKGLYSEQEDLLIQMEMEILKTVKWKITYKDPFSMLASFLITSGDIIDLHNEQLVEEIYYCGSYMIDLSLFDEYLLSQHIHVLVAIIINLAKFLVMEDEEKLNFTVCSCWREKMLLKYDLQDSIDEEDASKIQKLLTRRCLRSKNKDSKFNVIYQKYEKERYRKVSQLVLKKVKRLLSNES